MRYEIAIPRGVSPARIRVEAFYQSIDLAYVPAAEFSVLSPAMVPVSMASVEMSLTPAK